MTVSLFVTNKTAEQRTLLFTECIYIARNVTQITYVQLATGAEFGVVPSCRRLYPDIDGFFYDADISRRRFIAHLQFRADLRHCCMYIPCRISDQPTVQTGAE